MRWAEADVTYTQKSEELTRLGRYEEALAAIEKAMPLYQKEEAERRGKDEIQEGEIHAARSKILKILGRNKEALEEMEKSVQLRPKSGYLLKRKAGTLALLGRQTEAQETLKKAESLERRYTHIKALASFFFEEKVSS